MNLGINISLSGFNLVSLAQQLRSLFTRISPNGHMWLPGVGTNNGFDPRNYLDSAGTTPASTDGLCGLVLDAAGSVGSEVVTNPGGPFVATTGWASAAIAASTATVTGGELVVVPTVGYGRQITAISTTVGATYMATISARVVSGSSRAFVGWTTSSIGASATTLLQTTGTVANYNINFTATATTTYIVVGDDVNVAGGTLAFGKISVKEITGIHASQATPGAKPYERRGIVNLLTWSNDLTNAAWVKTDVTIQANAASGPTTGSVASNVIGAATSVAKYVAENYTFAASATYTLSSCIKANGFRYAQLTLPGAAAGAAQHANFDLQEGVVTYQTGGTATISPAGNGFFQIAWAAPTTTAATAAAGAVIFADSPNSGRVPSILGDGAKGYLLSSTGLFQGTLTAQQILSYGGIPLTTTAAASSTLGPQYLEFLASASRHLILGSAPLQLSDDFAVVLSAYSSNTGALGKVVFSAGGAGVGFLSIGFGATTNYPFVTWKDDLAGTQTLSDSANYGTSPCVITYWKVGNTKVLRVNGVQKGSEANAPASTTFNASLIGAQTIAGVKTLYHTGALFDDVLIKSTLTLADISTMESYAAKCAGGRLVAGAFVSDF